ncbi:MAG TPA: DegT/DnrJ/EryC1/StrS family aminotransferase [Tepidisphaeraceae bacterium]|nr:DegT/DnrJ/EryC1/StrS family aminotransferase [Tepidisphaeraceae bacterium]
MNVKLLDLQAQYLPLRNEIRRAIDEVCDQQALVLGPTVERFEKNLAAYCGTKHAIGVSSGTDALLCSLMALGIKAGDEVICPAFTFFATAGCIARLGATPVFCDIDPATFNADPKSVKSKMTRRTRAIMPVHLFGQLARMEAINDLAREHDVPVIEDAAQAIGAKRHGKPACAHGLAGGLSFYPTKNLGAFGDAGAICTSDDRFAEICRKLRVHGSGHTYHHEMIGGMFRIAAIQAAVLDVKLTHLDRWNQGRREHASIYDKAFAGSKVTAPPIEPENESIYNQYVVRVPNRDAVKQQLADRGIGTAIYYPIPLHLQDCFSYLGHNTGDFPESERACREVLALPVYPELPKEQVEYVAKELLEAVGS